MKIIFKFEGMNYEYIEDQAEGIIKEMRGKYQDEGYIREKIRNIKNQINTTIDNFENRITKYEKCKEEFKKVIEEEGE